MPPHQIFSALSDPTRFAIVEHLLDHGEQPVARLLERTEISAPALSRHLKTLVDKGVLTRRVAAQQRIYAVEPRALQTVAGWVLRHSDFWRASLDRLEAAMLAEGPGE